MNLVPEGHDWSRLVFGTGSIVPCA
jgi:hypothetical protein